MYSVSELKNILKARLSQKRYTHSLNVAEEAIRLAEEFGANKSDAYLAGLLHDICKEIPHDEQLKMVSKSQRDVTDVERSSPPLFHAVSGAWYTENTLEIRNEDILNAIRYHTVARENMSQLEKIIYLADLVSADRNYNDVSKMRKIAHQDLDKAMLSALKFSIEYVVAKGALIPVHTINAYNQYALQKKNAEAEKNIKEDI